ncbi:Trk system potassium transporter TrkA [Thalassoglobus polymorphus]|uniref:Trk system potassium uptake protein TrkA n=1 Tax=Thalassoglobus polymorphus TaxID=2527994 RepID=A0A517QGW8_9PLAN|nr:Trk system potassium transporter TrkA [Thalassoglobus polymorphus]QDT30855.1 Trk system potassium uptake protein TrkA [Thalassoglobus polymorphus]
MHAVILGAGTVGRSIAEILVQHDVDVCIIDEQREVLNQVEEQLDVQTVLGSACEAIPLFQAGVQNADLCLAVTSRDEVNLVGGSLSKVMGAKRTVARVFNPAYRDISTFDYQRHFGIDRLLSLEKLTALELAKGLSAPGLFAVENFARGGVQVLEASVAKRSKAVGQTIRELRLPPTVRIGLLVGEHGPCVPNAEQAIRAGDRVTLIGKQEALDDIRSLFEPRTQPTMSVIIAGGGEIGFHLAKLLDSKRYRVVILESDPKRCKHLSVRLEFATVLTGDATIRSELEEARVSSTDVFVAAMGRDEDNIVCGVEAKELGAKRILSIVRRPDYANVLERIGIDIAVSPREVMAGEIIGMVLTGPINRKSEIAGGAAEVWEVQVEEGAPCLDAKLKELKIKDCLIAAIVREDFVEVAKGDDQLRPEDTAVIIVQRGFEEAALAWFTAPVPS